MHLLKSIGLTTSLLMAANVFADITEKDVIENYADIAFANYNDALMTARDLSSAIDKLLNSPSASTLASAKSAWKTARVPYQQSEVFRFGNPVVDDWEGQLNAWPLDEGLIDYVSADNYDYELGNEGAIANIVANTSLKVGSETLDTGTITPELLASLNELGGSEANVASGYHAIEFLLWGQDLNGSNAGAGNRPASDFALGSACTNGNCDRRRDYLKAAVALLITDLEYMVGEWATGTKNNYRAGLLSENSDNAMRRILFGMGSLALGELAGERMKVALEANSYEDEHDCFSDNTHYSHFYNAQGIRNLYFGSYVATAGDSVSGPGIKDLLETLDSELAKSLTAKFDATKVAMTAIVNSAENQGMYFDQMIAPGNNKGAMLINSAISALVNTTGDIEAAAAKMGITDLNPDNADHSF